MYRNCAAGHLVFVSLCFCVFVHWENRLWQDVQKCTLSDSNSSSWANCCLKERHQVVFFCICALCVFVWKLDLWDKMSILSFSLDGWNYLQRMLCEISEAGGSLFITWLGMSVLEVCRSFSSPINLKSFTTDSLELKKLLSFPHSDNFPVSHINPGILLLLLGRPGDIPEKLNMFSISSLFLF